MIGEIRQNFTEASASVSLILATALNTQEFLSKKFCQVPKPNVARKNKWNGRGTGSTIGVLKSRFPAFFSSESRHPALFYARIPIPRHFFYEIFCLIIEVDVI